MKKFSLGVAPLLIAAAPAPPATLTPYVQDGVFDPGDFGWMRGAFPDATDSQKADWQAITDWGTACSTAATIDAKVELEAMGVTNPTLEGISSKDSSCAGVTSFTMLPAKFSSWEIFEAAAKDARARFDLFSYGATLGAQSTPGNPGNASDDTLTLLTAPTREQVYRKALSWQGGPAVKADTWLVLRPMFGFAFSQEDRKNTAMLKKFVVDKGWPSISKVGKPASNQAWLLVQHADHDPAFQLKALRLMEPLIAKGDVDKANYAYLYDRIMLKLSGKQRFGTQFMGCKSSEYKLRPLEPEVATGDAALDAVRKSMEMEPIAEYRKSMVEAFGPCE